jgi:predicted P-loop ATPase
VECTSIDLKALERDRDQLWAEAVYLWRKGHPTWLDTRELTEEAEIEQSARYEGDPWDDSIRRYLAIRSDVSIGEILTDCLKKEIGPSIHADQLRVVRSLRSQSWERYRSRSGEVREWRYRPD